MNRVSVHHGAAAQAIRLLRWWAEDCGDDPDVIEAIKQSKECARDLELSLTKHQERQPRRATKFQPGGPCHGPT